MAKKVSERLAESMQGLRNLAAHLPSDSTAAFHLGIAWGELNVTYQQAVEEEKAYANMCALVICRNPEKLTNAIKQVTEIFTGKGDEQNDITSCQSGHSTQDTGTEGTETKESMG